MADRLEQLRTRIQIGGGDPQRVRIVAVSKGFGASAIRAALDVGLEDFGENYAQELIAKASEVSVPRWHFIGNLQTNKVRQLAPHIHIWQSVDRLGLAKEIAKRVGGAKVMIEVNTSGEPQKGGCLPAEVSGLVGKCRDLGLDVVGLMTVGPLGEPEAARPGFARLRELAAEVQVKELSMGMSDDLEVAVSEGATIVRIGRALFGERDY